MMNVLKSIFNRLFSREISYYESQIRERDINIDRQIKLNIEKEKYVVSLKSKIEELQKELGELQNLKSFYQKNLSEVKLDLFHAKDTIKTCQDNLIKKEIEFKSAVAELSEDKKQISYLKDNCKMLLKKKDDCEKIIEEKQVTIVNLREEIDVYKQELHNQHISFHSMQHELEMLKSEYGKLDGEFEVFAIQNKSYLSEISKKSFVIKELESEVESLKKTIANLISDKESVLYALTQSNKEYDICKAELLKQKKDNDSLQNELKGKSMEMTEIEKQMSELTQKYNMSLEIVNECRKEIEDNKKTIENLNKEIKLCNQELYNRYVSCQSIKHNLERQISEYEHLKEEFDKTLIHNQINVSEMTRRLSRKSDTIQELELDVQSLNEELADKKEELNDSLSKLDQIKKENESLKMRISDLLTQIKDYTNKLIVAENKIKELESFINSSKNGLENMDSSDCSGEESCESQHVDKSLQEMSDDDDDIDIKCGAIEKEGRKTKSRISYGKNFKEEGNDCVLKNKDFPKIENDNQYHCCPLKNVDDNIKFNN